MFKKMIPVLMLVFISACANVQGTSNHSAMHCQCCESCQCCQSKSCECCKDKECKCKDGTCKMCQGKMKDASSDKTDKPCKICLESEKKSMRK